MKKFLIALSIFAFVISFKAYSQVAHTFTSSSLTYTQNFDIMGATGTDYPTGWNGIRYAGSGTVGATLAPVVGNGSANSGAVYNLGTTGEDERALGTLASGSTHPAFGAVFFNNTNNTITTLNLSGVMEQWRTGSNAVVERVVFEYSLDAIDLSSGTWTAIPEFDLVEKITGSTSAAAINGNLPENQTNITAVISGLSWTNSTNLWIRWRDEDNTSSDGAYAIDNFSITASTAIVPILSITAPATGAAWMQGATHNITWTASNTNANVKIELTSNSSAATPTWTTLVASVPAATGSWTWNIPLTQALSTDCKIRISDVPQTVTSNSGVFSIIAPPTEVATLAALRNGTPGTVYKYTGQATLTFKQTFRNQKYIQDATAAILIDDMSGKITTTYNIGDVITNITGEVAEFGNMMQFTPNGDPGAPVSTGNVITPQEVTLSQLYANWENYEAELIKLKNVEFTDATGDFATGKIYPIKGSAVADTGKFRTTFYNADYIGTPIPTTLVDIVVLPNSRNDGDYVTARSLSDFTANIPVITVLEPNGGEFIEQGKPFEIKWTSSNYSGDVKIELLGTNAGVIVASTANTGSYTWNVPATQAIADDYKVKISAVTGTLSDESNEVFSIIAPVVIPNLVITEIMYNSPGQDEEWVEIYNDENTAVDIEGYWLIDDVATHSKIIFPAGTTIEPKARFTVKIATSGAFPFEPDYDGSGKFSLNNTNDEVKLYHKIGTLIDSVKYYSTAPWPTQASGNGASLTLCDPSSDNSLVENWSASTEPFVTLQGTTIYATPGTGCYFLTEDIIITEIMFNPPNGNTDKLEFIEIYNKGNAPIDLKNWKITDDIGYNFPDTTINPKSFYIVAQDNVMFKNTFGIECDPWYVGSLGNTSGNIIVLDALGQTVDSVAYTNQAPWPLIPAEGGPSISFCNLNLDNSKGENWSASTMQAATNSIGQPIFASPGSLCPSESKLVITEIMYNSPESGADSLEFIEIYNLGAAANLKGYKFTAGIEFTFPDITLDSAKYILVSVNSEAIQNTFGKASLQWTSGGLSNSGELIQLSDSNGIVVNEVQYGIAEPWSPLANGQGASLTLCDHSSDNSIPENWSASTEFAAINAAGDTIWATPLSGCIGLAPVAAFYGEPTEILINESVSFFDESTNNPVEWSWTFEGGTPETSSEQNPVVIYTNEGKYDVTLEVTNEWGATSVTKTDYIIVGSVDVKYTIDEMMIYPNPSSGVFTLKHKGNTIDFIEIYSLYGQFIETIKINKNEQILDLTNYNPGTYFVKIIDSKSEKPKTVKIVIIK